MTDFLDEKRQEINQRLSELRPLVDEFHRLEAAAAALEGVGGNGVAPAPAARVSATPTPAPAKRRGPGRPRRTAAATPSSTTTAAAPRRRAGRRKGSGTRSAQALNFVKEQPGITIPELAARMGIKQNYLYRVLPSLEQEGKVAKQGRGWHAKA
ncbi:MAG TPA: winged helix-turn-helix domain-containing protein [Solirubrobacteraceae bacterium]|nr:winged helix-turn-helix domain-containing protein [Solirubrobacteraceae bacterium]